MKTQNEKHLFKNKIISELFLSGELQSKIDGILQRHHFPIHADLQNDIIQHTFEQLLNYDSDTLISMYNDNPKRLVGLAVRIMLRTGIYQYPNV